MLVPNCEPLKTEYIRARKTVALSSSKLSPISTPPETSQICGDFAIHHRLGNLHTRYNNGEVIFFANTGVLSEKVNRTTAWKEKSILFAHNRMTESTERMDPFKLAPGLGVLGRITDALSGLSCPVSGQKYKIGASSVSGVTTCLHGTKNKSPNTAILGPVKFDPYPWSERTKWSDLELLPLMYEINQADSLDSNVFGATWSVEFNKVVEENDLLSAAMEQATLTTVFPEDCDICAELQRIAELIKVKDLRGVDRDVFYASMAGWDHHASLEANSELKFSELDMGLELFWQEMNSQGIQDSVVLVVTSEFGRSLTPNSSSGTDHGKYFAFKKYHFAYFSCQYVDLLVKAGVSYNPWLLAGFILY